MVLVSKTDLIIRGKYWYSWKSVPGEDSRESERPEAASVRKDDGYEVLAFINSYAKRRGVTGLLNAWKLEDMVQACKEITCNELTAWIEENWSTWTTSLR